MTGHFISFEGGEGCGKSTHIRILAERLRAAGYEVILTREPGGTPLCEAVRGMLQYDSVGEPPCPEAEALLFCASRAQLVRNVIRPALERGAWILSDRFADSTIAYQGHGRGFDIATLKSILDFATGGLYPELTFLLTVPPEVERMRLGKRYAEGEAADRFEREAAEFHSRVRLGFEAIAAAEPKRVRKIPTDGPCDDTAASIWSEISARFGGATC